MLLAKCPRLQMIDFHIQERQVFPMIWILFHSWPSTQTVQFIMFDHDSVSGGAPLVKLKIGRLCRNSPVVINIQEWHYDHVFEEQTDWGAYVLDLALQSSCVSLASLTVYIMNLTTEGLVNMQRVLRQSDLHFLRIECEEFDPPLARDLRQVLEAVKWSTLRSLELSGTSIDGYINLWAKFGNITNLAPFEVRLLRLSIIGSGGEEQRLLHSSALWLHNMIYLLRRSPRTEARIGFIFDPEIKKFKILSLLSGHGNALFSYCRTRARQRRMQVRTWRSKEFFNQLGFLALACSFSFPFSVFPLTSLLLTSHVSLTFYSNTNG